MSENFINMWGLETLLGKRGVHSLLHCERRKWHSRVPSGNLETTRSDVGRRGQMPPMRRGGQRITPIVEMP